MKTYEFAVIGAGPAGILAVAALLKKGINPQDILWIDPYFQVGAFTKLWPNVPGNTAVKNHKIIFHEITNMLQEKYSLTLRNEKSLAIDTLDENSTCSLKEAAVPLQAITDMMVSIVNTYKGTATEIQKTNQGLNINVATKTQISIYQTKRVLAAIGAKPKRLELPFNNKIIEFPLETALSLPNLKKYITENPGKIAHTAVVGSSHSAALAVMNLLTAGVKVTQFMNKPYKFATTMYDENGTAQVHHDNTGLKGTVAAWTQQLLVNRHQNKYSNLWQCVIGQSTDLKPYDHIVSAIGLKPNDSLKIDGIISSEISYNKNNTETSVKGVFVIGAGHPLQTRDPSGELTYNVGISKFWPEFQRMTEHWIKNKNP